MENLFFCVHCDLASVYNFCFQEGLGDQFFAFCVCVTGFSKHHLGTMFLVSLHGDIHVLYFFYSGLVFCLCDGRPFNPFICFTDSALLLCGESV